MANYNKVILLGNLTRDVELRHTQGGMAIAKFGMAINRTWTQDGEKKESTCFVDLTAWGKTGETIAKYCSKGSQLFVEGRLEYSMWDDKDSGKKRSKLEVVVDHFQFVGGKAERVIGGDADETAATPKRTSKVADDRDYGDVPF